MTLHQLSGLDNVSYRTMMGEYIIYYRGKVVGGIYDDRFLVKPTKSAAARRLPGRGRRRSAAQRPCGRRHRDRLLDGAGARRLCLLQRRHPGARPETLRGPRLRPRRSRRRGPVFKNEPCGDGCSAVKEMRASMRKWLEIRAFWGFGSQKERG